MKKRWKIFWIFCGVMLLIGIAFCVAGIGMGATLQAVINAYDDVYYIEGTTVERWERDSKEVVKEVKELVQGDLPVENGFAYDGVGELDVNVGKAAVIVSTHSGDQILIDSGGLEDHQELHCEQDGDELEIELRGEDLLSDDNTVLIRLPEDLVLREASFEVGGGILQIENLLADNLKISVGAGDAEVLTFTSKVLDVECGAGHVSLMGEVQKDIDIECGLGSVELELAGAKADYNYTLECGIGVINLGGDQYSGLGYEERINNNQNKMINVECGVGTIMINFTESL